MTFILRVITDCFTIAILFSISIYHALIFIDRRKFEVEKYNIYFSLFIFSLALYIFFDNSLITLVIKENYLEKVVTSSVSFSVFLMIIFVAKFFSIIINIPKKMNKIFFLIFAFSIVPLLLSFTIILYGEKWYVKYLEGPVILIYIVMVIMLYSVFIFYFIKNKVYKDTLSLIILITTTIIIIYLVIDRTFIVLKLKNMFLSKNYIFIGLTVFIFAFALSKKFNKEFKELSELKSDLEKKVEQRTDELRKAKDEIEQASEMKSNFFINISHEIKTPLTLIENYLDKYIEESGENESLNIIKSNVVKLKNDILNIMSVEKINKGKILYENNSIINFSKFLEKQLLLFIEIAENKKISIEHNITKNIFIKIDSYALERLINNLVDNAIKYTPENGEVKISLSKDTDKIKFIVTDTGYGIEEEYRQHIFDPYFQISSRKSNIQGIGMGLSIVKSVIDEFNGEINIESQKDDGTKITVILETYDEQINSENENDIERKVSVSKEVLTKIKERTFNKNLKTALILEDNKEMMYYLYSSLIDNLNIYTVSNGVEALQKLNWIVKPDLIISDIMMDKMDGYEFFEEIKKNNEYKDIPFIFLTAKNKESEKLNGLQSGAIDFITKPFNINELKAKITAIMNMKDLFKKSNVKDFKMKLNEFLDKENSENNVYKMMIDYKINNKEMKIIELLIDGLEYKEISSQLNLSLSSIKKRIHEIYKKIGVQNKIELIKKIQENK